MLLEYLKRENKNHRDVSRQTVNYIHPIQPSASGDIVILPNDVLQLNSILGNEMLLPQRKFIENPLPYAPNNDSYNRKGHRAFAVFLLSIFVGKCRRAVSICGVFLRLSIMDFYISKIQMGGIYGEICTKKRYISEKVAAMWNYPTRSSAVAGNPTRPIWTSCLSPFKRNGGLIFQSCCGNQRTTSNSSDFAPIWLLGAQIKKELITAVFQTAYYRLLRLCVWLFN